MTAPICTTELHAPNVYAVVDEAEAVAAWIIELPAENVLAVFASGTTTYTTDSIECAFEFVNLVEGINGQLVAAAESRDEGSNQNA